MRLSFVGVLVLAALTWAVVLGLVLFVVTLGPLDFPWQRVTATMDVVPHVDGTKVQIDGTTDLPDGAIVDYYFWRDDAINEGPAGTATVAGSSFTFAHDLAGLPRGTWTVYTSFSTAWGFEQPNHVTDIFGQEGEHLAGPQVYVDSPGDPKQLLVATDVVVP